MKVKTKTKTRGFSKTKTISKKRDSLLTTRKRFCRFCQDNVKFIDYKDIKRLESFITDRGKIVASRLSGNCAKHQRLITEAIKKARFISLVPYIK
jgi:small subunit ribosomal protein S18